jgi:hypothetical protein
MWGPTLETSRSPRDRCLAQRREFTRSSRTPRWSTGLSSGSPTTLGLRAITWRLARQPVSCRSTLTMQVHRAHHSWRTAFRAEGREITATDAVTMDALDQVARERGITHIDSLKLDLEGVELAVLSGARELLANDRIESVSSSSATETRFARLPSRLRRPSRYPIHLLSSDSAGGPVRIEYQPNAKCLRWR